MRMTNFPLRAGPVFLIILAVIAGAAILAPWLPLPSPTANNLMGRLTPPMTNGYLFGGDNLGRDILSRILHGGRITLMIAALSVLFGALAGSVVGLLAGYYRGWVDAVLMRLVDLQLSIPLMLLALLIVSSLGPSITNLVLVLSLTSWVQYARVVRSEVISLREREFIRAAHAIALSDLRIIHRHILPNVTGSIIVIGTIELSRVIILESALSFLGLGVQPPTPSWGRMLADGRAFMNSAPWIAIFPGMAIFTVSLSINMVGDWLRDRLDPRLAN